LKKKQRGKGTPDVIDPLWCSMTRNDFILEYALRKLATDPDKVGDNPPGTYLRRALRTAVLLADVAEHEVPGIFGVAVAPKKATGL
jgi:hypothetical protein